MRQVFVLCSLYTVIKTNLFGQLKIPYQNVNYIMLSGKNQAILLSRMILFYYVKHEHMHVIHLYVYQEKKIKYFKMS